MRVYLPTTVDFAKTLLASIETKSKSCSMHTAHVLLTVMPSPCWAETAPGCTIYYGIEAEVAPKIEALRYSVLTWLRALINPEMSWEPSDPWPAPTALTEAIAALAPYCDGQNASVSANTAPTVSYSEAGSEPPRNASESSAP